MADENSLEGASTSEFTSVSSELSIEVNVKTLDSQIYTFRVDKNMPVPLFKEKIENVIGVPVGQQRLIFRGKVLKDDHLLSEYHVEDGNTLHLVARQPVQSQPSTGTSSGETIGNNDNRGNAASAGAPQHNRIGQVSHSVVLGSFNIGDQGEGIVPDFTQIIGAVLNSIGIGNQTSTGGASNILSSIASNASSQASQGVATEGTRGNVGGMSQTGNQVQPGQQFPLHPFQSLPQSLQFPLPGAAVAVPSHQMPIPDSLNTLSEFINRMELALSHNGYQPSPSPTNVGDPPRVEPSNARGLPTPEALSIVMRQAQQLLSRHAVDALSHIAGRLEGEGGSTDPAVRSQIQTESVQVGLAMQHLGALLLELGRTILTLRMGQSPAESLVNAGPAVYISPSGPNPMMVQPFALQTRSLFGGLAAQANPGNLGPVGVGDTARSINIHIHAGTSLAPGVLSVGSRANTGEATHGEQPNGTRSGDSGPMRMLPVRNVIAAAVPSHSPAEAASRVLNVLHPLHARLQQTNHSSSAPAQGSGVAVSSTAQASEGISIPQPHSESASIPTFVAEINSQLRNLVDNMRGENQLPSGQLEGSTLQGLSIGSGTGDDVGNHQQESMAVDGAGETSGLLPGGVSEREGQQHQPECRQFSNSEETSGRLSSKEASSTSSLGGSSSFPSGETALSCKSEVSAEDAPRSSKRHDPPGGDKTVPLGLGHGGLQPRRRSKLARSQEKNDGGTSSAPPVNQNQQSIASGQQVLQSLVSRVSNANRTDATGPPSRQMPPVFGQIMENMPLGAQASNGQFDVSSMVSQVLNSPALNGLLAGVSEQAGIGSPDGLRNMLEQFTRSPSTRSTLNQIAEQMDGQNLGNIFSGMGRGQGGGMDLSRMVQQMMPIVSEALTRGSTRPEPSRGVQPKPQRQCNESLPVRCDKPDDENSQIDLQQAAWRVERRDPPRDIFRTVIENAVHLYGDRIGSEDLVEELCSNEDLAKQFMEMLHRNIHRRLQADSESPDKS